MPVVKKLYKWSKKFSAVIITKIENGETFLFNSGDADFFKHEINCLNEKELTKNDYAKEYNKICEKYFKA